jgi:hypothetical protein
MTGELGHKKGNAFEQSISAMLTYLGFKIIKEFFQIPCVDSAHKSSSPEPEHSVDYLAEYSQDTSSSPRPFCSFDGPTFIDCTSAENLPETHFDRVAETLECLRKSKDFSGVRGAIIATSRALTPPLRNKLNKYPDLRCWDMPRLTLYGTLAEVLNSAKRQKSRTRIDASEQDFTTRILRTYAIPSPMEYYEADVFYEGELLLNKDGLREMLRQVRLLTRFSSTAFTRVHSLNGFTSDIPRVLESVRKSCSSRFHTIAIRPDDLYDYTRPWFAAFSSQPV